MRVSRGFQGGNMDDLSSVFWCPSCDQNAPAATLGPSAQSYDLLCMFCGCSDVIEQSDLAGDVDAAT